MHDKEDLKIRRQGVLVVGVILAIFTGVLFLNNFYDTWTWFFYPSLIIGVIFGIAFCIYLGTVWNPETLAMRPSKTESRINWLWGPPLGVLIANIIAHLFGKEINDIVFGITAGWLYTIFIYLAVQSWRHRPK